MYDESHAGLLKAHGREMKEASIHFFFPNQHVFIKQIYLGHFAPYER